MSFSDQKLFIVFRCCRRKISHFHRHRRTTWPLSTKLGTKNFLGKGLFKLKASYAFKGNVESLVWCLTIFFSRTTGQILTTVGTTLPWGNGFKFVKWRIISISERKIIRESKIRAGNLIIFSRSLWQILVKHATKQPWVKVFHMYSNER